MRKAIFAVIFGILFSLCSIFFVGCQMMNEGQNDNEVNQEQTGGSQNGGENSGEGDENTLKDEDVIGTWVAYKLIIVSISDGQEQEMDFCPDVTYVFKADKTQASGSMGEIRSVGVTWSIENNEIVFNTENVDTGNPDANQWAISLNGVRCTIDENGDLISPTKIPESEGDFIYKWYMKKQVG